MVEWTQEEEESIKRRKGEREKTREKNRLLHNRAAKEKGQHVLAPSQGAKMRCQYCDKEADWRRVLQWPKTQCSKE